MAIAVELLLTRLFFSLLELHKSRVSMLFLALFLFIFFSFSFLSISLYKILKRKKSVQEEEEEDKPVWNSLSIFRCALPSIAHQTSNSHPSIPVTLYSKFPKLASLIATSFPNDSSIERDGSAGNERICNGLELDRFKEEDYVKDGEQNGKKKKKRGKKKKSSSSSFQCDDGGEEQSRESQLQGSLQVKQSSSDCFYPFTSSSSMTQRKIKLQYDQLVKSHDSKALTLAQIFKLEAEQKRLEEDALVYNRLQQQLKLSPAYKQMLEIGARMELKASSDQLVGESADTEFSSISFEELLAQEKKDTFWQRNRRMRSCAD